MGQIARFPDRVRAAGNDELIITPLLARFAASDAVVRALG
jgi:hypothetical protein